MYNIHIYINIRRTYGKGVCTTRRGYTYGSVRVSMVTYYTCGIEIVHDGRIRAGGWFLCCYNPRINRPSHPIADNTRCQRKGKED